MTKTPSYKIRLRFSKTDRLRFIGHLDFLRIFQQMVRRSGLPVAYSQGFNPHQILSFALPLPLGMASINDYADISFVEEVAAEEIVSRLNHGAPQGLTVSAAYQPEGAAAAAAVIVADYSLATATPVEDAINQVLASTEIVIPKKTKSGIKDTDIRPDVLALQQCDGYVKMQLSAGSSKFINPLLVAQQILPTAPCVSNIARLELYKTCPGGGITPL